MIDDHIHIVPYSLLCPANTALFQRNAGERFSEIEELSRHPARFQKVMDEAGLTHAVLINYPSPTVMGFPPSVNDFASWYVREVAQPQRVVATGGFHLPALDDVQKAFDHFLQQGLRVLKIHPPHQEFFANAYREVQPQTDGPSYQTENKKLETLYRLAEREGIPVILHTGTSIFKGARNVYADPLYADDVAVDFPRLKLVLAHAGRPLWCETAFFLARRHPNVYLDISGIPPRRLLHYLPRLEEVADKVLFGSDWPSPGVTSIRKNIEDFQGLPLSPQTKEKILSLNALSVFFP